MLSHAQGSHLEGTFDDRNYTTTDDDAIHTRVGNTLELFSSDDTKSDSKRYSHIHELDIFTNSSKDFM